MLFQPQFLQALLKILFDQYHKPKTMHNNNYYAKATEYHYVLTMSRSTVLVYDSSSLAIEASAHATSDNSLSLLEDYNNRKDYNVPYYNQPLLYVPY